MALALVIEDSAEAAFVLRRALEVNQLDVQVIHHGDIAAKALETLVPDIVFLDLNLPFVHGEAILRQMKATPALANTYIILTTANLQAVETLRKHVDMVLPKPMLYSEVRDIVQKIMAGRES